MPEKKNEKEYYLKKRHIFLLLRLLYTSTDEQHKMTTTEILQYLEKQGYPINRKTLGDDMKLFNEEGIDIVKTTGAPNKYFWGSRTFELPEIKLLMDAVSSSRFVTAKKSKQLIKKLGTLISKYQAKEAVRHLNVTSRVKPDNESIYYIIDTITDAINTGKQISFQYIEYAIDKKKVFRNSGEIYTMSPYILYWNEDFYYVIGYSEKHEKVVCFRVDRIHKPVITSEVAIPKPDDFDETDYSREIFEMFDGKNTLVELKCESTLMKYVIDRFGEDVKTKKNADNTFTVSTAIALSPTFYGWVFQFMGKIKIVSPERAVEEYKDMVANAL